MLGATELVAPASKIVFPYLCPKCLKTTSLSSTAIWLNRRGTGVHYTVPCCHKCSGRLTKHERLLLLIAAGVAAVCVELVYFSISDRGVPLLALGALILCVLPGWLVLLGAFGPSIRISALGEKSVLLQITSFYYAQRFLDVNPEAFDLERWWRWSRRAAKMRGRAGLLITFGACYALYVGIVLPFAHIRYSGAVWVLGVPVAIAATHLWRKSSRSHRNT